MARKPAHTGPTPVDAFTHAEASRPNIPTADGAERWADDLTAEPISYERSKDFVEERAARNAALDPQLVWFGKDQQDDDDLIVEAPPLYIQEKIDPRVLIENLRKTAAEGEPEPEATLFDMFDGDLDELQQIEYYQHDAAWSNRMILGDSLQAMGSLAEREQLRGKVQMIYIDPPYGIKFNSNWQVSARKRDVKDGKDAAREVEQIKAFRDTWKDGIHTYLSYLRDRLAVVRDLLTESGSVFVQIGDENVHRVRALMDEVFGAENFVSQIAFQKTGGFAQSALPAIADYLLWFAKSADHVRVRPSFQHAPTPPVNDPNYRFVHLLDGTDRSMTKAERAAPWSVPDGARIFRNGPLTSSGGSPEPFVFEGQTYLPGSNSHWKTEPSRVLCRFYAGRISRVRDS